MQNGIRVKWSFLLLVMMLTINKTNETFRGAEYLAIYPYIDYENGNNQYCDGRYIQKGYYVKTQLSNGNIHLTPLKNWLIR